MLALARELAASPAFGTFTDAQGQRKPITPSALAEAARMVGALARRQPPATLPEAVRALKALGGSPLADRDRGMRLQLQALALTLPDRLGITQQGLRPGARVQDMEDLRYLLAWLQRIWKAGAPAQADTPGPGTGAAGTAAASKADPELPAIDPRWAKLKNFKPRD